MCNRVSACLATVCALLIAALTGADRAAAQATPCADLLVTGLDFSPDQPVQGQPANIAITIRNAGTCAAGGFVVQFKTDFFSPTGPSRAVTSLAAGASTTLNLSLNFTQSGNFQTVVQVDTGNAVPETNEVNNIEIAPVTVVSPGANLVVSDFELAPEPVVQGRTATASIEVTNVGNVPAGAFRVEWSPFFFGAPLSRQVNGLAAGASVTVTFDFTFPFAGTVDGTATADSTGMVPETNESDNSRSLRTVVEPPLPNLAFGGGEQPAIETDPAPAGSVSSITINVVNDGNDPSADFVVRWQPWFLAAPLTQQVNGLDVGESTSITFDYTFPFAGTFDGTVTLDSTGAVAEVDETDNTRSTRLEIAAATVDLTVSSLTLSPASPVQGAAAIASVTVTNLGNSPSGRFVVDWNPDAFGLIIPSVQTLSEETGPLGPGASRTIQFPFVYPRSGNFRSIARADSFNTVAETNEANNDRILNVTVQPAPLDLVFTGPITFNPAQPVRGQNATATMTVRNDGPIATGPFAVQFASQVGDIFPQTQFVNGLNPEETRTLTFTVNYFAAGSFTATATLDVFNQVNEAAPGGEANNVRTQAVTVVLPQATLDVTLNRLQAFNSMEFSSCVPIIGNPFDCGSGEWDNILYAVFDPAATCNAEFFGQQLEIPLLACTVAGDNDVNAGEAVNLNRTIRVTLIDQTPLVAAVAALESDAIIPDFPGFAVFISTRPAYLNLQGLQQVGGQSCARLTGSIFDPNVEFIPVGDGRCFDAFFGVSVVSVVGDRAASARSARVPAAKPIAGAAAAKTGTVAAKRAAYVRKAMRKLRNAVQAASAEVKGDRRALRLKVKTIRARTKAR